MTAGARPAGPISVEPSFAASYAAFLFEGLFRVRGSRRLHVTRDGFPAGSRGVVLLRVPDDAGELKVCFGPDDQSAVNEDALEWCDVYGKVNVDRSVAGAASRKLVAVGPTFGVRTWGPRASAVLRTKVMLAGGAPRRSKKGRDLWAQLRRRVPERAYVPGVSDDVYVFFAAWPWKQHPEVNPPRRAFIEACHRRTDLQFEGGFVPRRRHDMPELDAVTAERRYPLRAYLERARRSAVAFNTPGVHGCLGWKLGEFLALGKAIITLPIDRELPAPLVHGTHVHVVDGTAASLDDALDRLVHDRTYRARLEVASRAYYDEWVAPEPMVQRLLLVAREHAGRRDA